MLVIGYPKPRVEWVPDLKGATTLPGDPSVLVFSKAQLSQSGDYRCLTTNEIVDPMEFIQRVTLSRSE